MLLRAARVDTALDEPQNETRTSRGTSVLSSTNIDSSAVTHRGQHRSAEFQRHGAATKARGHGMTWMYVHVHGGISLHDTRPIFVRSRGLRQAAVRGSENWPASVFPVHTFLLCSSSNPCIASDSTVHSRTVAPTRSKTHGATRCMNNVFLGASPTVPQSRDQHD